MTRRISLKRLYASTAVALVVLGLSGVAHAHGDIRNSSPAAGTKVAQPPSDIVLMMAEPVAEGSSVVVTDGCGREVSTTAEIRREIFETAIEGGRPGRWKVAVRSISAVDGHLVRERFSFRVLGRKDCSGDEGDTDVSPDTSSRPPIENPDQGTSFPVVPFALGSVALIAVALALRRPWNKS